MAWTTPRNWVPGELVTASMMNIHLRDNMSFLYNMLTVWNVIPFSAGNFVGQGGTWTVSAGHVAYNKYLLFENAIFWQLTITGASAISGSATHLTVALPVAGRTFASVGSIGVCDYCNNNGTFVKALVGVYDGTHIAIYQENTGIIPVFGATVSLAFQKFFELTDV